MTASQSDSLHNQVQLVNFVLAELSTHSKVVGRDIVSFKSKDTVFVGCFVENVMSLRANTEQGMVEVRLTSATTDSMPVYEKAKRVSLHTIKTFYESVGRNYQQKAPSFSHSRIMAFDQNIDIGQTSFQKIRKIVIEVEEDLGPEFPFEIMFQIEQYISARKGQTFNDELILDKNSSFMSSGVKQTGSNVYTANKSFIENKQNGSLIAFVWGALLATYTRKVEQTGIKLALKSELYKEYKLEPILGKIAFNDANFKRDEQKHYFAILERLRNRGDSHDRTTLKLIENRLKLIFRNEVYSLYREEEVMAYLPKFIDIENLRIFRKEKHLNLEKKEESIFGKTAPINDMYFFASKVQTEPHEVNFDYALQNVESGIYGKYRIHCQLDFLCEVQLPQYVALNGGFLKGCESVIAPSVLEGYRTNYKINERDQQLLGKLYDEHRQKFKAVNEMIPRTGKDNDDNKNRDFSKVVEYEEKKPLDIINIEKFLYFMDLINRYLNEQQMLKAKLSQMSDRTESAKITKPNHQTSHKINMARFGEVFKTAKAITLSVLKEVSADTSKVTEATCFTSEALCRDRIIELENMISTLVQLLSSMELAFKGFETYLDKDTRMFIERDRYYMQLQRPNVVYDVMDENYIVDVNKRASENFFQKYKNVVSFIDENRLDRQQQKWFRHVPLKVHYLRPVMKEEEGIFVENPLDEVQRRKEIEELVNSFRYYKTIDL